MDNNNTIYNIEFLCSYIFYDKDLIYKNPLSIRYIQENKYNEDDEMSSIGIEYDKEVAEYLYKNELLYAFRLCDYNEDFVNEKIQTLYNTIFINSNKLQYNTRELTNTCKKLSAMLLTDNLEMGFTLLFSYNLYHITHICLCDLFTTGTIVPENSKILEDLVNDITSKK